MRYLAVDEVLRIHERAVVQYGGSLGVRDPGLLESALATPQQTMFGENLF
jgi:death-on-curing protein